MDNRQPTVKPKRPTAPKQEKTSPDALRQLVHDGDVLFAPLEKNVAPVKAPTKKNYKDMIEWTVAFAAVLVFALLFRQFVAEPIRIDGKSMLDTLQHNEYVWVTKFDYLQAEPRLFDVISCQYNDKGDTFVKRVAGLPGDTVELRAGDLFVNGQQIPQDFLTKRGTFDFGPVTVPAESYFVLGDNRGNSLDSRDAAVGFIPRAHIRGHVRQVVFPFANWRSVWDLRASQR